MAGHPDLAWSRKRSLYCSKKGSRVLTWTGVLFSHLQSGEWGPLPTAHPRLPFNPQLDRVTCLAFSWLESGASDSSCYIGGAGHRPGYSRPPPSLPALLPSASRQSHSGSFESWTPRSLKRSLGSRYVSEMEGAECWPRVSGGALELLSLPLWQLLLGTSRSVPDKSELQQLSGW